METCEDMEAYCERTEEMLKKRKRQFSDMWHPRELDFFEAAHAPSKRLRSSLETFRREEEQPDQELLN